jgi:dTDP-4-dehydrorhamnose 3,5-epimerase
VIFDEMSIVGAYVVSSEPVRDERGYFATVFDVDAFHARGLVTRVAQCSTSFNTVKGTLRGMHYTDPPEIKLVRCARGRVFDVVVDLRPESASYRAWAAAELSPANSRALYVPAGVAHGFYTLEDESEVQYQISRRYDPTAGRGVRWDDPAFGIQWPGAPVVIADRDRSYPDVDA